MKKAIIPIVLSMFLVFTMMPAESFAATSSAVDVDKINDGNIDAYTDASVSGKVEVTVQSDNKNVTVEGDVPTVSGKGGVTVYARNNTDELDVTVKGNITADKEGVSAYAEGGSTTTTVDVAGDVSSEKSYGVIAGAEGGGKTEVTVKGDVNSDKLEGVDATAWYNGSTTVNVKGNIKSEAEIYPGVYTASYSGTTTLNVGGSVSSNYNGLSLVSDGNGSSVNVVVQNDVIAENTGLEAYFYNGNPKINALINGTLHGEKTGVKYGVNYPESIDNIDITVWKIETGTGGDMFVYNGSKAEGDVLQKIRENVHYIVKLDDKAEGATLSADKDTANYGDTVLLKVNLQPGYQIDAAYGDEGKKVPLLKDADGNYYLKIDKDGGGIYLSVKTSKIKNNISYNLDGGSYNGQIGTITEVYDYGTAIKLLGAPTREGYKFLYWRGSQYDAGADYTVEGDHLFTAVWEKIVPKDTDDTDDTQDSYTPKTATKASPATGDESNLAVWVTILMIAVLALIDEFVRRRECSK